MSAECWGCSWGVAPVGVDALALPLDPLGACWECHVFGCPAHAERDAGSGKYMCFPSVATALSASAGIEEFPVTIWFESLDEFEKRFPRLAEATAEERHHFATSDGEGFLGDALDELNLRDVNFFLAAAALGVASFLQREARPPAGALEGMAARDRPRPGLIPGRLGEIAARLS